MVRWSGCGAQLGWFAEETQEQVKTVSNVEFSQYLYTPPPPRGNES